MLKYCLFFLIKLFSLYARTYSSAIECNFGKIKLAAVHDYQIDVGVREFAAFNDLPAQFFTILRKSEGLAAAACRYVVSEIKWILPDIGFDIIPSYYHLILLLSIKNR